MIKTKNYGLFFWIFIAFSSVASAESKTSIYDLPITLTDTEGSSLKLSSLKGKKVVMTMTYSSCQYACPRILQRVKAIQKNAKDGAKNISFVVVTFDPERDTPKRLSVVKKESNETANWMFLTGSPASVRQLSMVLGIRYQKNPETGDISHDNKIVVLNEKGVIVKELNGLNIDPSDSVE